jgi:multidrug efflux pump subunit AcrB
VRSSLETRLRPIFSSTLTAIFGMLPLVLIPGAGAEIYRGLAAVIVGGCLISHIFTLILIPAMLRIGESETMEGEEPAIEPLPRPKPRALRAAAE